MRSVTTLVIDGGELEKGKERIRLEAKLASVSGMAFHTLLVERCKYTAWFDFRAFFIYNWDTSKLCLGKINKRSDRKNGEDRSRRGGGTIAFPGTSYALKLAETF